MTIKMSQNYRSILANVFALVLIALGIVMLFAPARYCYDWEVILLSFACFVSGISTAPTSYIFHYSYIGGSLILGGLFALFINLVMKLFMKGQR